MNKARSNILKHKISFENATSVFKDENSISLYDEKHSTEEDRWITIGMDFQTRTLVVFGNFLSARKATKKEEKIYYED